MSANLLNEKPDVVERAVLGAMLRDNAVIGDVVQTLRTEHFAGAAHQTIFRQIVGLFDAGKPADLVSLGAKLRDDKQIADLGGYGYLATLWDCVTTGANAKYHAKIVLDNFILRSLGQAANDILYDIQGRGGDPEDALENAERAIFAIADAGLESSTVPLGQVFKEAWACDEERQQGKANGLLTGFAALDSMTGGLHPSELVIVAARPGQGKTSFGMALLHHIGRNLGQPVLFVSLEQSRVELAERLLCAQAGVSNHDVRTGALTSAQRSKMIEAGAFYRPAKVFIEDRPLQTVTRIAANARRLKLRDGLRMVIIDYLQLIEPESRREPRHEQVGQMTRRLKCLARELKIPVVVLAQLNRELENRPDRKPRCSDLRESGSVEQDADTIFLLNRPECFDPPTRPGEIDVIIGKQRNGPTGIVTLGYVSQFMRFVELPEPWDP